MKEQRFTWVPFYEELANVLLQYQDKYKRNELVDILNSVISDMSDKPRKFSEQGPIIDIDPFTIFGYINSWGFNKHIELLRKLANAFKLKASIPQDFDGVPGFDPRHTAYFGYGMEEIKRDVPKLWNLFVVAINYTEIPDDETKTKFCELFNACISQKQVGLTNLTQGLFSIRPFHFLPIDKQTKPYLYKSEFIPETVISFIKSTLQKETKWKKLADEFKFREDIDGSMYLSLCEICLSPKAHLSFPELSLNAYLANQKKADNYDIESDWFPPLDEYTPNITADDWLHYLQSDVCTDNYKMYLALLYDFGGTASCKQLENQYSKDASALSGIATNFAKSAAKFFKCEIRIDENGNKRYRSIPFVGRKATSSEAGEWIYRLRSELNEALEHYDILRYLTKETEVKQSVYPLNTILYGPPGTGKTYYTAIYAIAIIEQLPLNDVEKWPYDIVMERYKAYFEQGQIAFTTFHQSYGYEDFIEGIRPELPEEADNEEGNNSDLHYCLKSGVFKEFCQKASIPAFEKAVDYEINANPKIWKVSLEGTGPNATRTECMNNDHIRIGWDAYGENPDLNNLPHVEGWKEGFGKTVLNAFINRMKIGDIVFSCYSAYTIDAIGVITGNADWNDSYDNYKRFREVKWLAKDLNYDITEINGGKSMTLATVYALNSVTIDDVLKILPKKAPAENSEEEKQPNYVFIIDEINRGNISKIFGELITLIEDTKRAGMDECVPVKLPYSQKEFSVPDNVYILGTMNTADRSIALLDTALRRRFSFIEMMPDADVLSNINISIDTESLSIKDMLTKMNQKIEVLYNREHTIGHAYFYPLIKENTNSEKLKKLGEIFRDKIIPLLQEYFYDDYEKIRLVLGDSKKDIQDEYKFIVTNMETTGDDKPIDILTLFGEVNSDYDFTDQVTYRINNEAFDKIESYKKIL